jgi:hypothetical protein
VGILLLSWTIQFAIPLSEAGKFFKAWSSKGVMALEKEIEMKILMTSEVVETPLEHPLFAGPDVARQVFWPESLDFDLNVVNFGKGVRNKF